MRRWCLLLILVTLGSCGYFNSGTWEDDPDNWVRAFGQVMPEKVEVKHSHFWKSAHFTYEFMAYFEIKADEKFVKEYFIDHYELHKYDEQNDGSFGMLFDHDRPNWFITKDKEDYDIWLGDTIDFTLFIDKKTQLIYLSIVQL